MGSSSDAFGASHIHTYIHTYIQTYIHTDMHAYTQTCMHTYIHTYIHAYIIHAYIHIYIRTYTHTHTFMHTYIHAFIHAYIHTFIETFSTVCYLTFFVVSLIQSFVALISDPRRGYFMGLSMFIFFLFFFFFFSFFPPLLSGPYLWNRYSQRLQIECAAWSCFLILHYSLPSNSLCYFFFFFFSFFPPRFCPGHISGTVTRRDSKLSVLLGPAV